MRCQARHETTKGLSDAGDAFSKNMIFVNGLGLFSIIAKVFKVNTDKQRLDSAHIKSNMRGLGRIGIFSETIHKFLGNLKRQHTAFFDAV